LISSSKLPSATTKFNPVFLTIIRMHPCVFVSLWLNAF
jgi:hypothetical protein